MTDDFIERIADADPEELGAALEDAYGDGPLPLTMAEDLVAAGWDISDFEVEAPEYADEGAYGAGDELEARLSGLEQYLAETPASQIWPAQGYEYVPTEEEWQAAMLEHIDQGLEELEEQRGRPLSDAEIKRIATATLEGVTDEQPFGFDIQIASEIARDDFEQATDSHSGRVEAMSREIEEQQAPEPMDQEQYEALEEASHGENGHRARAELMNAQLDGSLQFEPDE